MSEPLIYVDKSEVRADALEELKDGIDELVEFLDANEPQLITYGVYFSNDGSEMTVVHMHADSASLEFHLDVGAPAFRKLADLLTLSSIEVYGNPSDKALRQLHEKGRLLGSDEVTVQSLHGGFSRLGRA